MNKKKPTLTELNAINKGTMMAFLGMEYLEVNEGEVYARMPVTERNRQPQGLLHGGSCVAFAETVGGLGSLYLIDHENFDVRGSQINANHIRAVKEGWVFAKATIIHQGKSTHVWNIDILNKAHEIVSTCRLTNFIVAK
ncbi:MAG: PaaI family thioesterase [Lentimicrobiaceae bacterium]|jgi:uncharacterized protein (TIGR00369 family)|nr:PaaI family thioesterase [Lentimicrobiaceae bacterium]